MLNTKTGVAGLSVASNATLVVLKLAVGLYIGSVSVIAEAIHSQMDLLAALIALFAVRASAIPPDEDHPYGHGKVENVSGTVESLLIFVAAGVIVYEAADKLMHGSQLEAVTLGLAVMGLSVVVNLVVSRRLMKVAKATDSVALEADAYHLTTDVVTSVGVFIGLLLVKLTGWAFLDPLVAIGVALIIAKAAWDITRRSFLDLLDRGLPRQDRTAIELVLGRHGGRISNYHRVRSRKSGSDRHIDLHLVVDGKIPVAEAHDLCDQLERELREVLGACTLTIHVEPCDSDCGVCAASCEPPAG